MRFLFVMDPYQSMAPEKDTSFAFMFAAAARGHEAWHCQPHEISNNGRHLSATARRLHFATAEELPEAAEDERLSLDMIDAVLIRKDPPFDSAYIHLTQQLDLLPSSVFVANDPRALRDANEKLYAFHFAEFMPRTLVSASTEELLRFVEEVGGRAVVKPLDGAGGAGVMGVETASRYARGVLDFVTREGRELALVQEFEPEVVDGDKRVLLLDGEILGAIRRVPRADDIRANIHVGGRVEAATLTDAERTLSETVGKKLKSVGLYFVGLDLIAGKLIEVNVTSPTGVQELGRLTGSEPAARFVQWLEGRVMGVSLKQ